MRTCMSQKNINYSYKSDYSIYIFFFYFLLISNSYLQQRIFFEIEEFFLKFSLKKKFFW